jgi:hypothetical protein
MCNVITTPKQYIILANIFGNKQKTGEKLTHDLSEYSSQ